MGLFDFLKKKELEEIERLKSQLEKYRPISDIDLEVERKNKEIRALTEKHSSEIEKSQEELSALSDKYKKQ